MATVVLVGTLDTKGAEYEFLRDRLGEHGVDMILVDVGILGEPKVEADVTRDEVARAAGADIGELARAGGRGAAGAAMAGGAGEVVKRLHAEGRLDGVLGLGGSGGSSLVTQAMRELPIGVPKLMVSTVASGDTRPYVGESDVTMMYSVVDIAGINQFSVRILSNAAGAIAGMAKAEVAEAGEDKPLVGATMFGVTTPLCRRGAGAARSPGLRGPGIPRHGCRRTLHGSLDARRVYHGRPGHDDHRTRRRARRRRALGRTRPSGGGRGAGHPASRLVGRSGYGQLRPA